MPAVPYKDEMNYNHQAKVWTVHPKLERLERRSSHGCWMLPFKGVKRQKLRLSRTGDLAMQPCMTLTRMSPGAVFCVPVST